MQPLHDSKRDLSSWQFVKNLLAKFDSIYVVSIYLNRTSEHDIYLRLSLSTSVASLGMSDGKDLLNSRNESSERIVPSSSLTLYLSCSSLSSILPTYKSHILDRIAGGI